MKDNMMSLLMAGMMGGVIALSGAYMIMPTTQTIQVQTDSSINNKASRFANNDGLSGRPDDFVTAAAAAMPAVVSISAITEYQAKSEREKRYFQFFGAPRPSESSGSGVIISDKGYIVTNNHVVKNATKVEVTLNDNRKFEATVVGKDPSTDLAVLKIDAKKLPTIEFADSDEAKIGEWVLAVGNPYELTSTVTAGIISAIGRDISILDGQSSIESFIQTDAAVNPGNSGGALVDANGKLLGINTAIYAPNGSYAGYSFAVPINLVKKVMQDLITHGEVKRAFLGIMIKDVNSDLAKDLQLAVTEGVYVSELIAGGSAEASDLTAGDVITKVNGVRTASVPKLQEQIGSKNPGESVVVTVNRKGKEQDITVKLLAK